MVVSIQLSNFSWLIYFLLESINHHPAWNQLWKKSEVQIKEWEAKRNIKDAHGGAKLDQIKLDLSIMIAVLDSSLILRNFSNPFKLFPVHLKISKDWRHYMTNNLRDSFNGSQVLILFFYIFYILGFDIVKSNLF